MSITRDNELRILTRLQIVKDLLSHCYPNNKEMMDDIWSFRDVVDELINRQEELIKHLDKSD